MVKKTILPKVLGIVRDYAPKLAKPKKVSEKVLDLSEGKSSYTVFDEAGLPIKDFNTEKAARDFLRGDPSANMYTVGKTGQPAKEEAPVLFYKSRETIVDAPQEKMSADRWLNYLNSKGIKKAEMRDTSLENFLVSSGTKTFTKKDLLKEFDEIAPDLEAIALGEQAPKSILNNLYKSVRKIDPDAQDTRVGGLVKYLQDSLPNVVKRDNNIDDAALNSVANNVNAYMEKVFGIRSALDEGVALNAPIPFKAKEPLVNLSAALGKRGAGLPQEAYARRPNYSGQQTLSGGDNYREILFKYKPGKLRKTEPEYNYAHDFGLDKSKAKNAFVHVRVSDRSDEFGRRLMFVEEIQSDMHQPIQRAMRDAKVRGTKFNPRDGYAMRGDLPPPKELAANKQQLDLINLKIENLLATNPRSKALPKLQEEREKIRNILAESMKSKNIGGGDIPEGPFQTSQEYMEFVSKYLLRIAKDGKYDGVAFSNPAIKNRNLSPGDRSYQGNLGAYGPILNKALSNVSKKTGANLLNTAIKTPEGQVYGGIKMLNLKNNKAAEEIISGGISAYQKGGVAHGRR